MLRFQVGYDKPQKTTYLVAAGIFDSEQRKLFEVAQQVDTDVRGIADIGPLRTEPERVYYFTGESVAEVGRRGENTFKLLAAIKYQGKQDELDHRLNWWLERLGYRLDVQVFRGSPLLQIGVRDKDVEGREQVYYLKDVGFGLSQVLPVLVQGLCPEDLLAYATEIP